MGLHFFNPNVAVSVGVKAAILFQNIAYWVAKNEANEQNYYDGRYWTYSSRTAFKKLFPYLSEKEIRNALKKLEDAGMIVTGEYNKSAYDRTKWYSITEYGYSVLQNAQVDADQLEDSTLPKGPINLDERANQLDSEGQPIPDINTNINTDRTKDTLYAAASAAANTETIQKRKKDSVPYKEIVDSFNEICKSLPKVTELSDGRKAAIRLRYKEYGKEKIIDVFRRAEQSDWLSGRSQNRRWCSFDWIMRPSNFIKIIEGTYDNYGGGYGGVNENIGSRSKKVPELFPDEYL